MKNRVSVLRWLYRLAWRLRPGVATLYVTVAIADVVAIGGFALALRDLVSLAMRHDAWLALVAAATAGLCWAVTTVGGSARANMGYLLAEAVSSEVDERVLLLVGDAKGIDQLEQPEYVDRLELVRGGGDVMVRTSWLVVELLSTLVRLAAVLVVLAIIAPVLVPLALVLAPALWLSRVGQRKVRNSLVATAEDARLAGHLHALLTEPGPGMEIRIAGAQRAIRERAARVWRRISGRQERAQWSASALTILGWAIFAFGYAVALLMIVGAVVSGRSPVADVLVLVALTTTLRTQAEGTIWMLRQAAEGMHLIDSFIWLTATTARPAVPVHEQDSGPAVLRQGIELRGVEFGYPGTAHPVLRGIDLTLPAGATVAIVGEHGAGKTTMVKLLGKLYEPAHGSIIVDGTPLTDIAHSSWRSRVTVAFQDFARFEFSAGESVGVGDLPASGDGQRIHQAIRDGGAQDVIRTLESGLSTQLGTRFGGIDLSGGQWQRIALSRAAMRRQPLLCVLDEPTASLDPRSEYAVYQHQMRLARRLAARFGTVTVIISHRFSTVRMADLIIVLQDGKIAERGSHDELMSQNGMYATLYRMQAAAYRHTEPPVGEPR